MTYSLDITGEASPLAGPILLAEGVFTLQLAPRGTLGAACQPGALQDPLSGLVKQVGSGLQPLSVQKKVISWDLT